MNKIWFLFFFVLITSSVFFNGYVVESYDQYFSEESVLIKVSGNILTPITKEKIALYRGEARSAAEINIEKINEYYYISFDLKNKVSGNYSLRMEDFEYVLSNKNIKEDLIIKFEVLDLVAPFSISPRVLITSKNFTIYLKNLEPFSDTINIETTNKEKIKIKKSEYNLRSGEGINVPFEIVLDGESSLEEITFSMGNYSQKSIIKIEKFEEADEEEDKEIAFEKESVSLNLSTNVQKTYYTNLKNIGETTVTNITLEVSKELKDFVTLSTEKINKLEKNESIKIEIYVNTSNESDKFNGYILANDDSKIYEYLYINLEIIPGYIPNSNSNEGEGNPFNNENNTLIDDTKKGINSKYIGWTIVVLLLIVLSWFFLKKYRGQKRSGIKFQLGRLKN